MRILTWYSSPATDSSAFWHYFGHGHTAAGHQLIYVNSLPIVELYGIRGLQRILLHYAQAYRVQAALILPGNVVEPAFVQSLRTRGIATVGLRFDDGIVASPGMPMPDRLTWQRFTAHDDHCDLTTTMCRSAPAISAAYGRPPLTYMPMPYPWQVVAPAAAPPEPVIRYCGGPRYVPGAPDSFRIQVVRALLAEGLPITCHHDGWAAVPGLAGVARPTPTAADMFDLMRRSAVNLCLPSEYQPTAHPMFKGLNLEIAATGALQVTYPSREVTDILGDTVATAETVADFVEQARHFLAHPAEGQATGRQSRYALAASGGWERYWTQVADHLGERGIHLDLGAPALRPTVQDSHVLYLTAIGLAHLFEGQGQTEQAEAYFQEALGYDPHDYAANAGLARLATDTAAAAGLWRTAHAGVGLTHPLFAKTGLPTKVLSGQGTLFAMESLVRWLAALFEEGRADEAVAAIEQAGHLQGSIGIETAGVLHQQGHVFHALRCLTSVIEADPGCVQAYRARSQVYRQQGLTAQADADLRQGEALSGHRRQVPPLPAE